MFLPRISSGLMSGRRDQKSSWNSGSRPSSSLPAILCRTSTSLPSGVPASSSLAMPAMARLPSPELAEIVGEVAARHGKRHALHRLAPPALPAWPPPPPPGRAEIVGEAPPRHGKRHALHRLARHHALQELLADARQHRVGEDRVDHAAAAFHLGAALAHQADHLVAVSEADSDEV